MKNNNQAKKVALFGGSFNPIHNQHIKMIEKLAKSEVIDEVWVIPCKKHAFNKGFAPAKQRIKMIQLAIKSIPNAKISRVELKSKGTTYTIKTLKELKSKYSHEFFWIIGSDIPYEIHQWKDYNKLLKEVKFIIFRRKGYPLKKVKGMKIFHVFNEHISDISSTKIRENAKQGKSLKGLVSSSIEAYIKKEGLYK
jgi:nicotinate-nucleotide adenylyltransferase